MRGWLIAMIGMVGCYSPTLPQGAPCAVDNDCPSDQSCVAGACRIGGGGGGDGGVGRGDGGGTGGGTGDSDGDGVLDASDNCPTVKNADQHNEDGDKFGDACDVCPQIKDDVGADADGDGVGDLCDPNPAAKDTLWLFDDFHALPSWSRSNNWAATANDAILMTAKGDTQMDGDGITAPITSTAVPNNFRATTTVMITAYQGSLGDHEAGIEILDANDPSFDRTIDCFLEHDDPSNGGGDFLFLTDTDTNTGLIKSATLTIKLNTTYRIALERHGTTYSCVLTKPDGTETKLTGTSQRVPLTSNMVDVGGFGATAQFGSLYVVGPPLTTP